MLNLGGANTMSYGALWFEIEFFGHDQLLCTNCKRKQIAVESGHVTVVLRNAHSFGYISHVPWVVVCRMLDWMPDCILWKKLFMLLSPDADAYFIDAEVPSWCVFVILQSIFNGFELEADSIACIAPLRHVINAGSPLLYTRVNITNGPIELTKKTWSHWERKHMHGGTLAFHRWC